MLAVRYLCSPYMPSWHLQGQMYLFTNLLLQKYSLCKESDGIFFNIFCNILKRKCFK